MEERGYDMLDAIARHSGGFADAAAGNLPARVEHCPDWTVADLVWHLTEVHWFWATIVEQRLDTPPDDGNRPARGGDEGLLEKFRQGALHLVEVLSGADPSSHVWTWAPAQQDVAFVARHQVQEAAVHHWDAVNAAGGRLAIEPRVASDGIDEFLTFSLSSDADPADPPRPALEGTFALRCADTGDAWTLTDGAAPGTVAKQAGAAPEIPQIAADASDLLLWLYGRVRLEPGDVSTELLERFRALTFTD